MAMWSSRTKAWGAKTRPVEVKVNGHSEDKKIDNSKDDELEDEDENIDRLKAKITAMNAHNVELFHRLNDKEKEVERLNKLLFENTIFLQKVVMELISLKAQPVPAPAPLVPARQALDSYLAKKNAAEAAKIAASDSTAGPKGKLP